MRALLILVLLFAGSLPPVGNAADLSDAEIRSLLIRQSIASYPGNCPCPYKLDRAGKLCGKRSAYSKPGGYSPLCFDHDVTQEMIDEFRRQRAAKRK